MIMGYIGMMINYITLYPPVSSNVASGEIPDQNLEVSSLANHGTKG
jgi:hypothetical protein